MWGMKNTNDNDASNDDYNDAKAAKCHFRPKYIRSAGNICRIVATIVVPLPKTGQVQSHPLCQYLSRTIVVELYDYIPSK